MDDDENAALRHVSDGGPVKAPFVTAQGLTRDFALELLERADPFDEDFKQFYRIADRTEEFDRVVSLLPDRLTPEEAQNTDPDAVCVTHFDPQSELETQDELARLLFRWANFAKYPRTVVETTPKDAMATADYKHRHRTPNQYKSETRQKPHKSSRKGRIEHASADLAGFNRLLCGVPLFLAKMLPTVPSTQLFSSESLWFDLIRTSLYALPDLNAALVRKRYGSDQFKASLTEFTDSRRRLDDAISELEAVWEPTLQTQTRLEALRRERTLRSRRFDDAVPLEYYQRTTILQLPTALLMTLFAMPSCGATREGFWNNSRSNALSSKGETNYPPLDAVVSWGHSRDLNLLIHDYFKYCCDSDARREAFWCALSGIPVSEGLKIASHPDLAVRRKFRVEWLDKQFAAAKTANRENSISARLAMLADLFDNPRYGGEASSLGTSPHATQLSLLVGKVLGESFSDDSSLDDRRFAQRNREYLDLLRRFETLSERVEELVQRDDVEDHSSPFLLDKERVKKSARNPPVPRQKSRRRGLRRPPQDPSVDLENPMPESAFPRNPCWKAADTVPVVDEFRSAYRELLEFEKFTVPGDKSSSCFLGHPTDFLFPALDPNRVHLEVSKDRPHAHRLVRSSDVVGVLAGAAEFLRSQFEKVLAQEHDRSLLLASFVGCAVRLLALVRRKFRNWSTELPFPHEPIPTLPTPCDVEADAQNIPATNDRVLVYFRKLPERLFRSASSPGEPLPVHAAWSQAFWWQNLDQTSQLTSTHPYRERESELDRLARELMLGRDVEVRDPLPPHQTQVERSFSPFDQLFPRKTHACYTVGQPGDETSQVVLTEKLNLLTRFGPTRLVYSHLPGYAEAFRSLAGVALLFRNHSSLRLPRRNPAYFERYDITVPPPRTTFEPAPPLPELRSLVLEKRTRDLDSLADSLATSIAQELAPQTAAFLRFWTSPQTFAPFVRNHAANVETVLFENRLRCSRPIPSDALPETPFDARPDSDSVALRERFDLLYPPGRNFGNSPGRLETGPILRRTSDHDALPRLHFTRLESQ